MRMSRNFESAVAVDVGDDLMTDTLVPHQLNGDIVHGRVGLHVLVFTYPPLLHRHYGFVLLVLYV